jgi:hypothetical protein
MNFRFHSPEIIKAEEKNLRLQQAKKRKQENNLYSQKSTSF